MSELKVLIEKTNAFLRESKLDISVLLQAPGDQKLLLLEKYANTLVADIEKKKEFLNLSSDLYNAYRAVLPDPSAEDYYDQVTAIRVIASRIRDVGSVSVDTSAIKKDLEDLLDKSIQAGKYVIPQHKSIKDLSALDANALHDFFAKLDNKNMQAEALRAELEAKIKEMMRKNKKRERFLERLTSLLSEYNNGAHDIDTTI